MKELIRALITTFLISAVGPASAGAISKGRDNRGVKLKFEGFDIGSNGAITFSLKCTKNWGGQVGGVAKVVVFYINSSGELAEKSASVSCHVRGGVDGARRNSTGSAKTITVPVPLSKIEARAYISYKETSNIDDALNNLEKEANKAIEGVTGGAIKKPLDLGKSLAEAVAPSGGDKLVFP